MRDIGVYGLYLHQEVKNTRVQGFRESVTSETRLFHVQCYVYGLWLATPFAIHLTAGEFFFKTMLIDAQQEGRKCQNYEQEREQFGRVRMVTAHNAIHKCFEMWNIQ